MNSIADILVQNKMILDAIEIFVNKYIGAQLLHKCGIVKVVDKIVPNDEYTYPDTPLSRLLGDIKDSEFLKKCVSAKQLLIDKLILCFFMGSAFRMFKTGTFYGNYQKDTFYRFDLLPHANWERLQLETARNVILDIEQQTDDSHCSALIFDDSLYQRFRGKGTQLCAKAFDHNDRKMRLGFRMMTGGWSNGDVYIPFAQSLLSTRDVDLMVGPDDKYDCRTLQGKRRQLAKTKGTEVVYHMVKCAQKSGIPFDVVLFDTWFSNPAQLVALKEINANVIAMIKKSSTKYTVITDPKSGKTIEAKLVYARNHSNRKDWVCFICTDTSLSEEEVLKRYLIRWNTETYFKICKSYLKLRTECHSTNYDALTSHMVIVSIRYMVLALERFRNTDNRTIEDIFYQVQREVVSQLIDTAIIIVLDAMLESVREFFGTSEEQINQLVHTFIEKLPTVWKERFQSPVPA